MNNNKENYKKAIEQIHVDENLKYKVLEQVKKEENKIKKPIYFFRFAVCVAATLVVAVVGVNFVNKTKDDVLNVKNETPIKLEFSEKEKNLALENVNIKRFNSIEELREKLEENYDENNFRGIYALSTAMNDAKEESVKSSDTSSLNSEIMDYSKTNNQVEDVDEADIVKTDGKYIYYSKNNVVYIVDKDLNLKSIIKEDNFSPSQIFVNGNKLIVFGSFYKNFVGYNTIKSEIDSIISEDVYTYVKPKTYAKVYNINDIENPNLIREIAIDGYYNDARMIDDNIYFISNYNIYLYKNIREMKDDEILPTYKDSSISKEDIVIEARKIACFDDSSNYQYSIIAGFNLNSNEEVNIETFFGFGTEIYASKNNLYIICEKHLISDYFDTNTIIYKFKLENSSVIAKASCKIEGNINNQFSIDEYDGNLRVATTINRYNRFEDDEESKTKLTIFNENLEKIGEIDNLIDDEKIYAVRFIGNVGYIVTFEQIDPLWVIDLSDPTAPVVKGELEIPGYSSYLNPYDETHIIGIGYDVKSNGYGGVKNDTIKLSMFDVSDLENPKEIFKINFENKNAYSSIMYEHKSLFFNKNANLIGFPINSYNSKKHSSGLLLYKIDMENNKFEEVTELLDAKKFYFPERAIYIGNNIYVLYQNDILRYDINTFEKNGYLKLDE